MIVEQVGSQWQVIQCRGLRGSDNTCRVVWKIGHTGSDRKEGQVGGVL